MAMAAISSSSPTFTAASINVNPSTKFTSLSSSGSVFFSYSISSRAGLVSGARRAASNKKKKGLSCNCLFGLGVPELVVIAGVTVLLFGPKQLPEVGRSFGKTIKSFQQAAKEFESELKKDVEEEQITTVSEEKKEKKQEAEVPITTDSS
ncbi:hypothetical protein BUALT_Bualt19G0057200 [Buddleja alternifolia]|uniref:Sec-independent protein translocase protein TATA, chloroplastic n=1 Tax=Buddleja alternifolia TaxID=168488 RepID=A0AAV6W9P5_9LAMI|nr:hypothetical protein BUALT_Bualt19G0057200 [Buddleja alternifolia]